MDKKFLSGFKRFAWVSLLIFITLEIFVFNYKSFVLIGGNYDSMFIPIENIQTKNLTADGNVYTATNDDSPTLTFQINKRVKTLQFMIERADTNFKEIEGNLYYSYYGYSHGKRESHKIVQIVPKDERTQYITGSYFGDVYEIDLKLKLNAGEKISIRGVNVNRQIPFHFSFVRLCFLYLISLILYVFVKHPSLRKTYNPKAVSHKFVTIAVICMMIVLQIGIMYMYVGKTDLFTNTTGNQLTKELVDAFEHGQVSLLDEVPKELFSLENPYDWSQRMEQSTSYKWDHLVYKGKYYTYYGIGPVITLFLPYHMLTGYYFSAPLAVILFSVIGTLFICLCYLSVIKNWLKNLPCNLIILGMILTAMGSGVLCNIVCPQFYEICQSAGMCFSAIGFYFMVNSGIFQKKTIKKHMLFWSAVFMSLAVLSRVVSAFWAIIMVVWVGYGFFQNEKDKGKHAKERIKYLALALVPYVFFGVIQMTYNYARFGSPFDFGIEYTLSIYDFLSTEISFGLVMVSLVNFFTTMPVINTTFPFIHDNFDYIGLNGYYFVGSNDAVGMIPRILPLLSLLYIPKAARWFNRKDKIKFFLIWFIPVVILPVIIAGMTWQYGYGQRYVCDFAWEMILGVLVLAFSVFSKIKNAALKKWLYRAMFVSTIWCVICAMALVFKTVPGTSVYLHPHGTDMYYHIRNLVMFWN